MTGFFDGLLAIIFAAILNIIVLAQIRMRSESTERPFVVRVYFWAVLLRSGLAIVLNVFAGRLRSRRHSGRLGPYDAGGHQLALKWSGEPITTAYMSAR